MISKTVELEDYMDLRQGGGLTAYVEALSRCRGAGFDVYEPHEHRTWEYGSALQAFKDRQSAINVGCGYTAFGLALATKGYDIWECDADSKCVGAAREIAEWSRARGLNHCQPFVFDLSEKHDDLHTHQAVFCISTIEHIPPDQQDQAWANLVAMVAPQGLLFVTTDVCQEWKPGHERATYFSMDDITRRIDWLRERGFKIEADLTYHGDLVDLGRGIPPFTFFRLAATRS